MHIAFYPYMHFPTGNLDINFRKNSQCYTHFIILSHFYLFFSSVLISSILCCQLLKCGLEITLNSDFELRTWVHVKTLQLTSYMNSKMSFYYCEAIILVFKIRRKQIIFSVLFFIFNGKRLIYKMCLRIIIIFFNVCPLTKNLAIWNLAYPYMWLHFFYITNRENFLTK